MMNVNDENVKEKWDSIDHENLEKAFFYLKKSNVDIKDYLAEIVANLCDINTEDIMIKSMASHIVKPRWLYWFAYRYVTRESYVQMAYSLNINGKKFTPSGIMYGVGCMSTLIDTEPLWNRRWTNIKRIIKLKEQNDKQIDNTIVIQVPKDLKGKINITIKDK